MNDWVENLSAVVVGGVGVALATSENRIMAILGLVILALWVAFAVLYFRFRNLNKKVDQLQNHLLRRKDSDGL